MVGLLSCVVACYNEIGAIEELHRRISAACCSSGVRDYEIVLVNDGSEDRTWHAIETICDIDPHVVGIDLARNHGHQLALTAGLESARGDVVFILDADLQDPPELLGDMLLIMDREKADVVYGRRRSRDSETWFKRGTAAVFYRALRFLSEVDIPINTGDFRLIHRRVVDVLNNMPERHRFIRGMISWIGFKQIAFEYDRAPRYAGKTTYSFGKMMAFAVDAITGFSISPLRLASVIGLTTGAIAILLFGYTLISYLSLGTVKGWTSIMATILLFGSVQMFFWASLASISGGFSYNQRIDRFILCEKFVDAKLFPTSGLSKKQKPQQNENSKNSD